MKIYNFHLVKKDNKGKETWYAWRSISGKQKWVYIGGDAALTEDEIVLRARAKIKAWCKKHKLEELLRDVPTLYTEDSLEERLRHLEERGERHEKRINELNREVVLLRQRTKSQEDRKAQKNQGDVSGDVAPKNPSYEQKREAILNEVKSRRVSANKLEHGTKKGVVTKLKRGESVTDKMVEKLYARLLELTRE